MQRTQPGTQESSLSTLQDYIDRLSTHYASDGSKSSRWYTRIVKDCNLYITSSLRHTIMVDITPDMLQEAINRVCRLGGKRYQSIVSGIRDCFKLATLDGTVTVNPALSIHVREINNTMTAIDDELFGQIMRQIGQVPGGHVFGLAGFADTSMKSISLVARDDCDAQEHTILVRRGHTDKIARILDPDGIALMDDVLATYESRMESPAYARTNADRLLCTNRLGMPYTEKQFLAIVELIRDACNNPNVDVASFRKYVRYRQLL